MTIMPHDPINTGYARALLEMAQAEGVVGRIEEDMYRLRELLRSNPALLEFLKDPNIQREGKRHALSELFTGRVHPLALNALLTLSDTDRSSRVLHIIEEFLAAAAAIRQQVTGEVVTAHTLDDPTRQRLQAELSRVTGKSVQLFQKVDPSILGGAIIRIGEQVIDGSLRHKLERIKDKLVH